MATVIDERSYARKIAFFFYEFMLFKWCDTYIIIMVVLGINWARLIKRPNFKDCNGTRN